MFNSFHLLNKLIDVREIKSSYIDSMPTQYFFFIHVGAYLLTSVERAANKRFNIAAYELKRGTKYILIKQGMVGEAL